MQCGQEGRSGVPAVLNAARAPAPQCVLSKAIFRLDGRLRLSLPIMELGVLNGNGECNKRLESWVPPPPHP